MKDRGNFVITMLCGCALLYMLFLVARVLIFGAGS